MKNRGDVVYADNTMSILREAIRDEMRISKDLLNIQEGLDSLMKTETLLQEWSIISASKNLANGIKNLPATIKDLPNYRMAILSGKDGKWILTRDMGKLDIVFYDNKGGFVKETHPASEFTKKLNEIRSEGNEVIRDFNGLRKFIGWFLIAGVKRGTTQLILAGIIAILLGLILVFPTMATISIFGTTLGALAGAWGGITALTLAKSGAINLTVGKVSKKLIQMPHEKNK